MNLMVGRLNFLNELLFVCDMFLNFCMLKYVEVVSIGFQEVLMQVGIGEVSVVELSQSCNYLKK